METKKPHYGAILRKEIIYEKNLKTLNLHYLYFSRSLIIVKFVDLPPLRVKGVDKGGRVKVLFLKAL